jgi:hypothetical protein
VKICDADGLRVTPDKVDIVEESPFTHRSTTDNVFHHPIRGLGREHRAPDHPPLMRLEATWVNRVIFIMGSNVFIVMCEG